LRSAVELAVRDQHCREGFSVFDLDAPAVRPMLEQKERSLLRRRSYGLLDKRIEDGQEVNIEESAEVHLLGTDPDGVPDKVERREESSARESN